MTGGPIVVAGLPRSGSTWTANVLGRAGTRQLVHEPDNEKQWVTAFGAKRALGRFPCLAPGDRDVAYESVWGHALAGTPIESSTRTGRLAARVWQRVSPDQREHALSGRPRAQARAAIALGSLATALGSRTAVEGASVSSDPVAPPLVKTVHAPLALEWLTARFPGVRVVVILRHPANVLSSWLAMGLPDQDRRLDESVAVRRRHLEPWAVGDPPADPVGRAAWQVCLLTAALVDAAQRHPEWVVVSHEDLCVDPVERFAELAAALQLPFDDTAATFLDESNRAGEGFAIQRRSSELPDAWRHRLDPGAQQALAVELGRFPGLARWAADLAVDPPREPLLDLHNDLSTDLSSPSTSGKEN